MCFSETPPPKKPSKTPNGSQPAGGTEEPCHPACTLTSETFAASPSNLARTKIGVGEEVFLTITGNPATWEIQSGNGELDPSTGTTNFVSFIAGETADTVTIVATCSGCSCVNTITFNVVEPSDWTMIRKPGTNLRHNHGHPDCGWLGEMYIHPNDVNFYNVEIREKDSLSVATGSYNPSHHGKYHGSYPPPDRASPWLVMANHTETNGSQLDAEDQIYSGYPHSSVTGTAPPFNVGTYYWEIVMQWRVIGKATINDFPTVRQELEIFSDGKCETKKGGHSETCMYNDPTSSW